MEYAQLESRITFLDEEYRREKAEVAQLRHKLELSEAEKEELGKRIEALEGELAETRKQLAKVTLLEEMLERLKGEMKTALEEQRLAQKRALQDAERSRALELESHTKAINEVRKEVERSQNLAELVALARAETDRQGGMLTAFQQRLDAMARQNDDQLRSISYLEDQHRSDAKRIAELKAETTDLFKQTALQRSKIELLEQQIPQFGQFQRELAKVREDIRAEVERAQYQHAQTERTLKAWAEQSEQWQRRLDEYDRRMERYAEHYQRNLKALEALQSFQEQLRRDQHEFMELHRLNADRQKNLLEEWQAEQEEARRKHILDVEHKLNDVRRQVDKMQAGVDKLLQEFPRLSNQITLLLKIAEEDALQRALAARDWQNRFEQLVLDENE